MTAGNIAVMLADKFLCATANPRRDFVDLNTFQPRPVLFQTAFVNVRYCFNGREVYIESNENPRVYIGSTYAPSTFPGLEGACVGRDQTALGQKGTSVYITCNAAFSNKSAKSYRAASILNLTDTNSQFTIPSGLNGSISLGGLGSISSGSGAVISRYFTMRMYPGGCYEISGVGSTARTCLL